MAGDPNLKATEPQSLSKAEGARPDANRSRLGRLWHRHSQGVLGAGLLLLVTVVALLASHLTHYNPDALGAGALQQPPSLQHLFGTDNLGRDVFSRVVYGARISLVAGLIAVGISVLLGTLVGLVAGYLGGAVDYAVMRIVDAMMAFPSLILMIAFSALFGPGLTNAMIAIGISSAPGFARLVRGQVLSIKPRDFVEAARTTGAGRWYIASRHVLPNILPPVIIWASLGVGGAILAEAGLSFLGLGAQPPTPEWGAMVNQGDAYLTLAPWMAIAPGAAIFVTVLGINLLGDALRDAWDPRLRGI